MDTEVYSFALKNALNEIQKACPDIKNTFIFRENGEVLAGDESTQENTVVSVINAFDAIAEKAEAIGDIEGLILESHNGRVRISHINDLYLVTVTSQNADTRYVDTLNRVLIPTVLKLLENINPTPLTNTPPSHTEPEPPISHRFKEPTHENMEEPAEEEPESLQPIERHEIKPELPPIETPVNQLIVENLGGLLVPSDTVRIDNEVLGQWESLYDGRKIEDVEIETFDGKKLEAKVKPIKDSKYEGKGIVQMPEKIQLALEITKGELVRVKPMIE